MNDSRRDDWVGVICVIVLLIGTATGNALVLLGMSVATMLLITIFFRPRGRGGSLMVTMVAALTASLIGIYLAMR